MGFRERMARFMVGRYGMDLLGRATNKSSLCFLVAAIALSLFARLFSGIGFRIVELLSLLCYFAGIGLLGYGYFRMFSRNIARRSEENRRYLQAKARFSQRKTHCFFRCPNCRTRVRVPRHKGKICITCPRCKNEFIRRT